MKRNNIPSEGEICLINIPIQVRFIKMAIYKETNENGIDELEDGWVMEVMGGQRYAYSGEPIIARLSKNGRPVSNSISSSLARRGFEAQVHNQFHIYVRKWKLFKLNILKHEMIRKLPFNPERLWIWLNKKGTIVTIYAEVFAAWELSVLDTYINLKAPGFDFTSDDSIDIDNYWWVKNFHYFTEKGVKIIGKIPTIEERQSVHIYNDLYDYLAMKMEVKMELVKGIIHRLYRKEKLLWAYHNPNGKKHDYEYFLKNASEREIKLVFGKYFSEANAAMQD